MPTARRYAKSPKLSSTQRSGVSQPVARKVDAVLKDLRTCSRQLSTSQPCLSDEMRVLERLYYKGVNQHRSAKFWKRVQDIRKCCKRITEVDLLSFVDNLRYAFYANDATDRKCVINCPLHTSCIQVSCYKSQDSQICLATSARC